MTAPDVLIFQRESKAFSGEGGYVAAGYDLTGAGPLPCRGGKGERYDIPVPRDRSDPGAHIHPGRRYTGCSGSRDQLRALAREIPEDPGVLGKTIDLDRRPYTIVGVMPQDFEFPLDAGRLSHRDVWVPLSLTPVEKSSEGENYDYGSWSGFGQVSAQLKHK